MQFTQHVVITAPDEDALLALVEAWSGEDTEGTGFLGGRLLRFRDKPGRYVLQADFDSWESAETNNDRPETQQWAARLNDLIEGDPKYENLDVLRDF